MTLRIAFMGTPDFAVPTLLEIVGQGHEVAAVYTQPPRPAGRGMADRRSPVHEAAERFAIPVRTPATLRSGDDQAAFAALGADLAVVVAYGLLLPDAVLLAPPLGCLNLHASLLPRWRGAAPIQRAIMAGDRETGVMAMRMESGLDTGPVCMAERVPIAPEDTAGGLHDRLARLGADLMVRAVAAAERGALHCVPQDEAGVTYAAKIRKEETRIDWRKAADRVLCHVHGLSPFPGTWCEMQIGGSMERVRILRVAEAEAAAAPGTILPGDGLTVACGSGALRILELQRSGKRPVSGEEFRRGANRGLEIVP